MRILTIIGAAVLAACAPLEDSGALPPGTSAFTASKENCGPTKDMIRSLYLGKREILTASATMIANQDTGVVVTFYASPWGSWTALLTAPDGNACKIMWGLNWQPHKFTKKGKQI